jgi:16S rRNA (guanine966-N2)-methyltransferase
MKIISGKARNFCIKTPNKFYRKGFRPTKTSLRESIFSSIELNKLKNSKVLDLFSGTGSFGFEALSRGAKIIYFVEKEKILIKFLKKNANRIEKYFDKNKFSIRVFYKDAINWIKNNRNTNFDIIFIDPPYNFFKKNRFLNLFFKFLFNNLNKFGLLIIEVFKKFYNSLLKEITKTNFFLLKKIGKKERYQCLIFKKISYKNLK